MRTYTIELTWKTKDTITIDLPDHLPPEVAKRRIEDRVYGGDYEEWETGQDPELLGIQVKD